MIELFTDVETAWNAWKHMVTTSWKHLLVAGGILDQPEALWHDVIEIEAYNRWYRRTTGIDSQ